jgi:polyhydroxyalkanoate synthase
MEHEKVVKKFGNFARMDDANSASFVAIERWVEDGIKLTMPALRQSLREWIMFDGLLNNSWSVNGTNIDPNTLNIPTLVVIGSRDNIAPPSSSLALGAHNVLQMDTGHIGLVASPKAITTIWQPLYAWINSVATGCVNH